MLPHSPISSCCTFKSCSMASLSALMVSTCSIRFLSSWTAGLDADDDDAAPTLGIAADNSACNTQTTDGRLFLNGYNRPFPHSNKQWHRVEVGVDKNTVNVWNCPPQPRSGAIVRTHWSGMRERSLSKAGPRTTWNQSANYFLKLNNNSRRLKKGKPWPLGYLILISIDFYDFNSPFSP